MPTIQIPEYNTEVVFPDDMPQEEMVRILQEKFPPPANSSKGIENVYDVDRDVVLSAPVGAAPQQIRYYDDVQNLGQSKSEYYGYNKISMPKDSSFYDDAMAVLALPTEDIVLQTNRAVTAGARYLRELGIVDEQTISAFIDKMAAGNERLNQSVIEKRQKAGGGFGTDVYVGLTQLPYYAGMASAKGAAIIYGLIGSSNAERIYQEAVQANPEDPNALAKASGVGFTSAAVEATLGRLFFKNLMPKLGEKFVPHVAKVAIIGGAEEAGASLSEDIGTVALDVREKSAVQIIEDGLYSFAVGSFVGTSAASVAQLPALKEKLTSAGVKNPDEVIEAIKTEGEKFGAEIESTLNDEANILNQDPSQTDAVNKAIQNIASQNYEGIANEMQALGFDEQQIKANIANLKTIAADAARTAAVAAQDRKAAALESAEQTVVKPSVDPEIIQGRIRKLDDEIDGIDNQIDLLVDKIEGREKQSLPNIANNKRLNKLLEQRDRLDEQRASLLTEETPIRKKAQALKAADNDITIKGKDIAKAADESVRRQKQAINEGFRRGISVAKKNVKDAQSIVVDMVKKSGLTDADKSKFINAVKNVQTAEQLPNAMARIRSRMIVLAEKQARREIRSAIKKALTSTKTKTESGRKTGKLTPEIQDTMDSLRFLSKTTKEDAASLLVERLSSGKEFTDREILENRLLDAIAEGADVNTKELAEFLADIRSLIETGKTARGQELEKRKAQEQKTKEKIIELIGDTSQLKPDNFFAEYVRSLKESATNGINSWAGNFNTKLRVAFNSRDSAAVEDFLANEASIMDEQLANVDGREKRIKAFVKDITSKTKMSERQFMKRMFSDESNVVFIGKFTHSDGAIRQVNMTRSEMRQRYMESLNDQVKERLMNPKANAYTDEIISAIRQNLDEVDMQIIESTLDYYRNFYPDINAVYKKLNGVNLGMVETYVPIRAEKVDAEDTNEFLTSMAMYRGGVSPASLKQRQLSSSELKLAGDFQTLLTYTQQMQYYITHVEKVSSMRRVFMDSAVQKKLRESIGAKGVELINSDLDYFARKGIIMSRLAGKTIETLTRNFSFAQLALKPQIALKQLTSFPAYMDGVKTMDFMAGLSDLAANPKNALDVLRQSNLWQNRPGTIDQDFQAMFSDKSKLNFLSRRPSLAKMLMTFITYGDKGALYLGGYARYYAERKAGKTHEQALRSFELSTERAQQSSSADQLSELQRSPYPLARMLTQFMSAPNSLFRAQLSALIEFKKGRISNQEFAKKMFIYHVLIPQIFTVVANGFSWDDEDQLRALIIGQINGVFLFGELIEAVVSKALTDEYFPMDIRNPLAVFLQLMDSLVGEKASVNALNEVTFEEFMDGSKEVYDVMKAGGQVTGIPVHTFYMQMVGVKGLAEGDFNQANSMKALGYSPYAIKKTTGEPALNKAGE